MKKIIVVSLSILCMCCIAIGLTGCSNNGHVHAFDKQVVTDEYKATDATCTEKATYYYSCSCGEKGTQAFTSGNTLGHSFTNYVSDNNATCTEDGTKTAKCDRCSVTDTVADEGSKLPHTFDKKVVNEKYLASAATCTEKATYYYSCSCGEKGTETFTSGNALGHSFTNYVSDNNATCTQDGTKTAKCNRCDKKDTVKDTDSKLNHSYTEQIVSDEYLAAPATCNKKATYYYSCECGATGIETFEYGSTTDHNFVNGRCTYCGKEQEASKGLAFTLLGDGTYEVSGIGSCKDTEIVIPSVYNNKLVTSIGNYAFYDCRGLTSITIGGSVTSIGERAFGSCCGLTSITIPDSVTSIGSWAFYNCIGLTSVTIGGSVTSIGEWAFYNCRGLTSITIGGSVTSIGDDAFSCCNKLVEVINKSALNITKGSYNNGYIAYYALNVKEDGTSDIVNKGGYLFYTYANVNYLLAYVGSNTGLTLPADYNGQNYEIYNYAFEGCSGLTSITIPDSVNSIGDVAFWGCSGLTSITIGGSVTSIGEWAFEYCISLTSVIIPESVTSIGAGAFSGCSGIESFVVTTGNKKYHSANNCIIETETKKLTIGCKNSVIPTDGSVTSIGSHAFRDCSGLTSITIPDSVTSIGYKAFYNCSGLTSITIGGSVTSISGSAFFDCSKLKNITYRGTIADWKNITKGYEWRYNVPTTCVIHCTDGDIKISD